MSRKIAADLLKEHGKVVESLNGSTIQSLINIIVRYFSAHTSYITTK